MSAVKTTATAAGPGTGRRAPPASARKAGAPGSGTGTEAKRRAAVILEVLAGVRTPAAAAAGLSLSLPRYYLLEQQALTGLVAACEPRPQGRVPGVEKELTTLQKEVQRLHRECARQQALVRAAQRTIGLTLPEPPKGKVVPQGRRRSRRPTVRALKAAARLQSAADHADALPAAATSSAGGVGEGAVNLTTTV